MFDKGCHAARRGATDLEFHVDHVINFNTRLMTVAEKYFHPNGNRTCYAIYLSTALNIYLVCIFYFCRSPQDTHACARPCVARNCPLTRLYTYTYVSTHVYNIHTYTFILYLKRSRKIDRIGAYRRRDAVAN